MLDSVDSFDVYTVYTAERLLADMDLAGVEEAVVVGYPICEWTDNYYTRRAAAEYDRLYGVVMVEPFADDAAEHLQECMAVDGVLGVRLGAACPYGRVWKTFDPGVTWLRDAIEETRFWEAVVEMDAAVQILCDHSQLDQALELVETYPDLTYLFDHFAHADRRGHVRPVRRSRCLRRRRGEGLRDSPHSETGFPYADMHDHIWLFVETFGRERIVWGSDYPNVSDVTDYAASHNWRRAVGSLSKQDHEWLTGRSFREHVGLD